MATDYKFEGWMGKDESSAEGKMVWQGYDPKPFNEEDDVDIQITHCGICGSDLHTLRSGWGPSNYPVCVGHEIVGKVVKVGSKVTHVKVGDRAGVGAQCSSCLKPDCDFCPQGEENHCPNCIPTYDGQYPDGSKSYGGYGDYWRGPSYFVFAIPEGLPSAHAAPMLCGATTVFSPLKRAFDSSADGKSGGKGIGKIEGKGKAAGIVGVGGLGHFGILFAKAIGYTHVTAISRSNSKKADAFKLGADAFIATSEDEDWASKNANTLDVIVCTASSPDMPIAGYIQCLRQFGKIVQVGMPEGPISQFALTSLVPGNKSLSGSFIGPPREVREMLEIAASKKVKPWVEEVPLKDANKAIVDMANNKARYRYVLVNEKHA